MSQWGYCEVFHTGWNQLFFAKSFAFLLLPVTADSGLIRTLSYLFVCFSPMSAFPGKAGHYACLSLDHTLAAWPPTSRQARIERCLISGALAEGASWPHVEMLQIWHIWQYSRSALWLGHHRATRWLPRPTKPSLHLLKQVNPLAKASTAAPV